MPRTKAATDKKQRNRKLGRNIALTTGGAALVTSTGLYGKNVAGRVKVAKGLEKLEVEDIMKKAVNASMLGKQRTADKLLSESTNKAAKYAQTTNLNRAGNIIKSDVKKLGSKLLSKVIRRGK